MSWDFLSPLVSPLILRLLAASVDLAVLAALAWGGIRLLRPRSPRLVALLWLLVMIRPLAGLAFGPLVSVDLPMVTVEAPLTGQTLREEVEIRQPLLGQAVKTVERVQIDGAVATGSAASGLGWLWMAGIAGLLLAAAMDRLRLRRLLRETEPAPPVLRQRLDTVARRLGVPAGSRLPDLLVTRSLESPALAGTRRPAILVPAWLVEEGSAEQLDWSLGHELMHWKARDHWAAAVRQLFRTVFFFHPVAWWVGRRWEESAELACDRALVSSEEEAASYAERLYEMLAQARGRRRVTVAGGLFATRTQIGRRIAALLRVQVAGPERLTARSAAALGLVALLSLSVGAGCRPVQTHPIKSDIEYMHGGGGGDGKFTFEADGRIALTRNQDDVAAMRPGSRMVVEEVRSDGNIRLEVTGGPDGEIRRAYTVGGKARPYNWEGRVWLARALPRFGPFLDPLGTINPALRPAVRSWRRMTDHARRLLD